MARWEPWQVIDGAYKDDARPWSAQDTCNWLPTPAEQGGTRSPIMLQTPPGLVELCDLGTNAPVRGSHDVEGLLLVVSGDTLFKVVSGVATSIGTIPGVGRVSMDHIPRGDGFQVGIANGTSGYVYDTADNSLVQITDEGFPGAVIFQFIDNYLAFLEPFGRFWGHSDLNDALSYNTLDRYTAESAPDPIRSLIVSHREVFTPGTRSGEFFRNTGAATGTFARSDGTEMERGVASAFAIARLDNTVYWLGEDGVVYRLEGHQPVRVSNGPLEQALKNNNLANAFAFTWEDKGHNVFYLTLPDGQTWGYDAWTNRWHRRQSYGLTRWRLATLTKSGGQWIGGDYRNGKLYTLSWADDAVHENGEPLVSERTFPVAHDNFNDLIINGIRLLVDTGKVGPSGPSISGDLQDGTVGDVEAYAYTVSGAGVTCSLESGATPPGTMLNENCTITGTRTEEGTATWVVKAVDSFGNELLHPDSSITVDPQTWMLSVDALPTVPAYIGKYSGDVWTLAGDSALSAPMHYSGVGVVHIANRGGSNYRYSTDYGATWGGVGGGTWSSGGGRMLTLGGFLFVCGGVQPIYRRTLPASAFTNPTADTASRANTIVLHGVNRIVVASIYNGPASWSTDNGATWASGGGVLSTTYSGSPCLGSNGTTLIALFNDGGANNLVRIKRSIDGGSTWSAAVYTFPGADANKLAVDVLASGTNWVAINSMGQVAYSSDDGLTWTLSVDNVGLPRQAAIGNLTGAPRVMVAGAGGLLYSSDDLGVTWQARTDPAGTTDINGIAWVYP